MSRIPDTTGVAALYTRRTRSYVRYIQAFGHRQGLRALLEAIPPPSADGRVLDAGCGTGPSILAMCQAAARRDPRDAGCPLIQGFDLTPAMLEACRASMEQHGIADVELRQADVCALDRQLPPSWSDYDLIVCASMLEHLPAGALPHALAALGRRLAPDGRLLAVVTRKSFYPARWIWRCAGYDRDQLTEALAAAGLPEHRFRRYPVTYGWLNVGNHVIEAARQSSP